MSNVTYSNGRPTTAIQTITISGLTVALRDLVSQFVGIDEVRILPDQDRYGHKRSKVFVVYSTFDLSRDEKLVAALDAWDVDLDLVPAKSAALISSNARTV
jgi:hypothetical protein